MAGFDEVMERLVADPEFRSRLSADTASALAGYELTEDEAALLASGLEDAGGHSRVEQRTSKAGLAGLLSVFQAGSAGSPPQEPMPTHDDDPDVGTSASETSGHRLYVGTLGMDPPDQPAGNFELQRMMSSFNQGDTLPAPDADGVDAFRYTDTNPATEDGSPGAAAHPDFLWHPARSAAEETDADLDFAASAPEASRAGSGAGVEVESAAFAGRGMDIAAVDGMPADAHAVQDDVAPPGGEPVPGAPIDCEGYTHLPTKLPG